MTFGATAWVAATNLRDARLRWRFLNAFAWFGWALSLVSVMTYFTSRGRILWIFASPYPDVWGPFLSRNDFAGFVEEFSSGVVAGDGSPDAGFPVRYGSRLGYNLGTRLGTFMGPRLDAGSRTGLGLAGRHDLNCWRKRVWFWG
jgi:hypothetical protein